jgi:Mg-chelatase subunit ChlD
MNGGTNIAAALAKAGSLLKGDGDSGPCTRRVLVLLTDGRCDVSQQPLKVKLSHLLSVQSTPLSACVCSTGFSPSVSVVLNRV